MTSAQIQYFNQFLLLRATSATKNKQCMGQIHENVCSQLVGEIVHSSSDACKRRIKGSTKGAYL